MAEDYESSSYQSAEACWAALEGIKQPLMDRVERYASLTIPKICLPVGFNTESTDQTHDYQSAGAQGTNHLTNKVMLALFAPSRPFFRVDVGDAAAAEFAKAGIQKEQVAPILAKMERDAVSKLDALGQRPKLYQCIRHLIVAGNVLQVLGDEDIRVVALRNYCVKRDQQGRVCTLIIRECLKYDELDKDVRDSLTGKFTNEAEVHHYRWIERDYDTGDYKLTQWVNSDKLAEKFSGSWPEDKFPYRVLTWDLADDSDYGTGLVEEYAGDLEAMSVLSEAVVDGAVLGTEYRWLVNPTGVTTVDDLNNSKNGDALPGKPDDVAPSQGGNPTAIEVANRVLEKYERRVAMGFLMQSGVTRDAERVTAEEVRQTAMELETAFGGVYSMLAQIIQKPIAIWLLAKSGRPIHGLDLTVSVITGLDALSRNGDLENLRAALNDLAGTMAVPPQLQARLKWDALVAFVGDGRGVDLRPFVMSEQEFQAEVQRQQQQQAQQAGAVSNAETAGAQAATPQGNP